VKGARVCLSLVVEPTTLPPTTTTISTTEKGTTPSGDGNTDKQVENPDGRHIVDLIVARLFCKPTKISLNQTINFVLEKLTGLIQYDQWK